MSTFVRFDKLDDIAAALHLVMGEENHAAATRIVKRYEDTAAKRTGFMASSGYTVTEHETTYGAKLAGDGPMLPQVEKPDDDQTALAAIAAEYAAWVEHGTSNMGAQPAFYPAVDAEAKRLAHELEQLEQKIRAHIGKGAGE